MSTADYTIRQGDTEPVFAQQFNYSDGTVVDLTGATVSLILRDLVSATPLTLTGTVTAGSTPANGIVTYTPTTADTAAPGSYMGNWLVVFAGGQQMTFPTDGYLWVTIEENLTTVGGQQLVGLPEVKDYLNLKRQSREHDAKLMRLIHAIRPVVEQICGPIIPTVFEEWHDGGQPFIQIRRRPSTAYGTTPVLDLIGVDEYRGPTKYTLAVVADPAAGGTYSVHMDRLGKITRRTSGGGTIAFPPASESVHVWYRAGQSKVPENVRDGCLELIRVNSEVTQAVGRGALTVADEQDSGPALKAGVPRYVRQMLAPNRRAPSIA